MVEAWFVYWLGPNLSLIFGIVVGALVITGALAALVMVIEDYL